MARFRKSPVVVEATQWFPGKDVPGVFHWTVSGKDIPNVCTAHGREEFLEPGDWVIAEPDGSGYYSCKPDIFEATYEPVELAMNNTFVCAMCGKTFDEGNEEEALEESKVVFGQFPKEELAVVCDDCWKKFLNKRSVTHDHTGEVPDYQGPGG